MSDYDRACAKSKPDITELPDIMRRKGWGRGAYLMDRWIHSPANNNAAHGSHDVDTISMAWVLSFGQALVAYKGAKARKVWLSEKAKEAIIEKLIDGKNSRPKAVGERLEIGNLGEGLMRTPSEVAKFHKNWQIQYHPVKQSIFGSPLNDLYAALGDFHFYYLVKGWVERLEDRNGQPRYMATIDKVGVYVMDRYDFNDNEWYTKIVSQPLGDWGCKWPYVSRNPISARRRYVNNKSFRDWRKKNNRGGDFLVFSNIKVFDTNDSFEFP